MRHLIAISLLCVLLAACGKPRIMQFTYVKHAVSDAEADRIEQILRDTDGVLKVIPKHDSRDKLTVTLHLDEDEQAPGKRRARELGFRRLRE